MMTACPIIDWRNHSHRISDTLHMKISGDLSSSLSKGGIQRGKDLGHMQWREKG
jgi:hypothetical protein